jgi:hypothetical protein
LSDPYTPFRLLLAALVFAVFAAVLLLGGR